MSLASKLQALVNGLEDTREAIEGKGSSLPAGSPLSDYPAAVEAIEGSGGEPWVDPPPPSLNSLDHMFRGWKWLESAPLLDTSNVISMHSMFYQCASLVEVPPFDTSNVITMTSMFHGCQSLVEVEFNDCSKVTNVSGMFGTSAGSSQAKSLERLILPGMTRGFNLLFTNMDATALNDFFHSLGTASGSQTININGAPGASTCDKSIATAKGWAITG